MQRIAAACLLVAAPAFGAEPPPHNQDRAPGQALTPAEAIAKFKVPLGFQVKLFASEPEIVNPVAMTFDEKGRVWITESLEYPRKSAGPGRDRIKILEDTDGDGKADKATVFAEGLNIPSGIAVGYGGVFVVNSPDLLFLKDADGDGKADSREVLLTGFGRDDTHELPCALTWGPDGWLYGLNGVFNYCHVVHQGKTHDFTCALWRYHPVTKKFELFAEGTSNPWGLDYDANGNFFISACVIDHLWHLTETGYYHRQGGPYPPFTWKIESIVRHKHQKAAYCGLCWYDAPTYPKEYRGTLFMGNIHGNCVNNDGLKRRGASYLGVLRDDFLSTDDAWFMPVVQKVGPDGCLWVVDWYDRYHCYQDANRDPAGIDRLKGRIYRVTHNDTPMAPKFDLAKKTTAELTKLLDDPNVYFRREARRLLIERELPAPTRESLGGLAADHPLEKIWLHASRGDVPPDVLRTLLKDSDPRVRDWAVRIAGEKRDALDESSRTSIDSMTSAESNLDVLLQLAIAAPKLSGVDPLTRLLEVLAKAHEDESELVAKIAWRNLQPIVGGRMDRVVAWLKVHDLKTLPAVERLLPRLLEQSLAQAKQHPADLALLIGVLVKSGDANLSGSGLRTLLTAALSGEMPAGAVSKFRSEFEPDLRKVVEAADRRDPRYAPSLGFLTAFSAAPIEPHMDLVLDGGRVGFADRSLLARAFIRGGDAATIEAFGRSLATQGRERPEFQRDVISAFGATSRPEVAPALLAAWPKLNPAVAPQVLDVLASRPIWAGPLLDAVAAKRIPTGALNANQLRRILDSGDARLEARVKGIWGAIRTTRNPEREKLVAEYRRLIQRGGPIHAENGAKVYERVCAQCHQFRGKGYAVGPKLDDNGRSGLDQLLSNVLDPNLVIGKDYQARLVLTEDGRSLTGLLAEDSPSRIVLKLAGDKQEVIPREKVEKMRLSDISLMPEGLEKQMTPQEFRDLIGYLLKP